MTKQKVNNERGVGNVMALVAIVIALVLWGIFSLVMSAVQKSQSARKKNTEEFFESRKPKVEKKVRREIKGYTLSY